MMQTMSYFSDRLVTHLKAIGASPYVLVEWNAAHPEGLSEQYLYALCRGEKTPTQKTLERLASIQNLKLTLDDLKAWNGIDILGPESIKIAAAELLADKQAELGKDTLKQAALLADEIRKERKK